MISGIVDPRFAGLRTAFESCFADGLEHGASLAVELDGKPVAELWGGHADAAGTRPWQRDTLVNIWSATKDVLALAVALLVERGKLDYAAPVASVWPEFAAGGKEHISLDLVLSHRAGLNGLDVPMTMDGLYAWRPYVEALAAMAPLWAPGSRCVYHAVTLGHLAGEPLRRADGRGVGRFIAEEIAGPLEVPLHVGLPVAEDPWVAEIVDGPGAADWATGVRASAHPQSVENPAMAPSLPNQRAWRAAEIPGANGHGTAAALARLYGALAAGGAIDGRRLISPETIVEASRERFRGIEESSGLSTAFAAGFRIHDDDFGTRASARSFGHSGWGGTIAFADPEARLGFAFVTCRMLGFADGIDPRRRRLVEAVYDAL